MNYIFDLDGTIINSSDSIRLALRYAFSNIGAYDVFIPDNAIGPPIRSAVKTLMPDIKDAHIDVVVADFCDIYDRKFCLSFSLIQDAVSFLEKLNIDDRAFIVTNKRYIPAARIFKSRIFFEKFEEKICVDSVGYENLTKGERINQLITDYNLPKSECLYIGDHDDDEVAASIASIAFLRAW